MDEDASPDSPDVSRAPASDSPPCLTRSSRALCLTQTAEATRRLESMQRLLAKEEAIDEALAESRAKLLAALENTLELQARLHGLQGRLHGQEIAGYEKEVASVQLRVMLEQLEIKYGIKMDTASSSNGRRDAWFKFLSSTNAHADRLMREIVSLAYNTSSPDWDKLNSARKQHMTTEVATEIANLFSELSKDVHGTPSHDITFRKPVYPPALQHLAGMLNFRGTRYYIRRPRPLLLEPLQPRPRLRHRACACGTATGAASRAATGAAAAAAARADADADALDAMMPAAECSRCPRAGLPGAGSGHLLLQYLSLHLAMGAPWAKSFCPAALPVLAECRAMVGPMIVGCPQCIHPIVLVP